MARRVKNPSTVRRHATVDADGVHGRHHLIAGNLRRPVERAGPRAARVVAFVGVNLGIERRHDLHPSAKPVPFGSGMFGFLPR
jgi:hypothetical protein